MNTIQGFGGSVIAALHRVGGKFASGPCCTTSRCALYPCPCVSIVVNTTSITTAAKMPSLPAASAMTVPSAHLVRHQCVVIPCIHQFAQDGGHRGGIIQEHEALAHPNPVGVGGLLSQTHQQPQNLEVAEGLGGAARVMKCKRPPGLIGQMLLVDENRDSRHRLQGRQTCRLTRAHMCFATLYACPMPAPPIVFSPGA